MTSKLDVESVSVGYAGTPVLRRLSLTVDAGEIVAILGSSGSGKSTLLRVVAGLITPDSGDVRLDGITVTTVPTHRRGVGMVFQDEQLFEHLDVTGNIEYGLKLRRLPTATRRKRVAELLDVVGLGGFGSRRVTELSGGEAKRVALARSLAPRPRVMLLDEPLTGLDRDLHRRLAGDLAAILREERTTALLVTHDHDEAEAIADRVVTIAALMDASIPAPLAEAVPVEAILELRRRVLRRGTPSDVVEMDGDDDPATRHLAVRDATGNVVATSTWLERENPDRPGERALQLRGMAVADSHRRTGLGAVLLDAGADLAAERGIAVLWANARDSAIDFYASQGFHVVGDGFLTADTQLPHHRVIREL